MTTALAFENLKQNHLIQEDFAVYNKNREEYLSSTHLKLLIKESAADLRYDIDNPSNETKPSYILGNAVHCLVLEKNTAYQNSFVIGGPKNKNGEEFGMASDAFSEKRLDVNKNGKELITQKAHSIAWAMKKSCFNHYLVRSILDSGGLSEHVLRTEYMGIKCQVRFDHISPVYGIPDLKTCKDLKLFLREARYKYGYFYQAGYYQSIAYHVAPQFGHMPFSFIAVESKPPYKVGVFEISEQGNYYHNGMEYYRHGIMDALIYLKQCRDTNTWPTGYEDLITI